MPRGQVLELMRPQGKKLQRPCKSICTRKSAFKHLQGLRSTASAYNNSGHVRSTNILVTLMPTSPNLQLVDAERKYFLPLQATDFSWGEELRLKFQSSIKILSERGHFMLFEIIFVTGRMTRPFCSLKVTPKVVKIALSLKSRGWTISINGPKVGLWETQIQQFILW